MNRICIVLLIVWNQLIIHTGCQSYNPDPDDVEEIAGGTPSSIAEFPHMAAIGYNGDNGTTEWFCGGSLISKKYVLTAAHCIVTNVGDPKQVRLGDRDLSTDTEDAKPQNFNIVRIIPHPSYKPPSRYHDIALLELDREAEFNEYVSPATLNTEKDLQESKLIATGWGKTGYTDSPSNSLLKVTLDIVPNDICTKAYEKTSKNVLPNGIVEDFQICAGKVKGQDTCQGDSGGPLQLRNRRSPLKYKVYDIYGITSFGRVCALSGAPGVYTRVSNYVPWIQSITGKNQ